MQEDDQSPQPKEEDIIRRKVEDGSYFRDGMDWYHHIYHAPITQKAYFVIMTVLSLIVIFIALIALSNIFPLSKEIPFIIKVNNIDRYEALIEPLSEKSQDVNMQVIEFLVDDYVTRRERYDLNYLQEDIARVRFLSGRSVFQQYRNALDASNPTSPIAMYERHSSRRVTILSTQLSYEGTKAKDPLPNHAIIDFSTEVKGRKTEPVKHWQAELHFDYKPVVVDQEAGTASMMEMHVVQYRVRSVSPGNQR